MVRVVHMVPALHMVHVVHMLHTGHLVLMVCVFDLMPMVHSACDLFSGCVSCSVLVGCGSYGLCRPHGA